MFLTPGGKDYIMVSVERSVYELVDKPELIQMPSLSDRLSLFVFHTSGKPHLSQRDTDSPELLQCSHPSWKIPLLHMLETKVELTKFK
ncbi:hypothetical protein RRG08_041567 [Elysia crispata]|uniref:Uncharacterized protein n=1 Tax=Elysia crispata TaxID=231223 RepID=A0AAE0ZUY0_9GAST|nr:hypothetical protein RRG08_041567 [Elysia crispata]